MTGRTSPPAEAPVPPPSFAEATAIWARIGLLSFGGPAAQIALMHRILVDEKRWISDRRFLHALNFCMLLPGPEAQQLATYSGWLLHGTRGGIVAGTLFVLPGFCVIVGLSIAYALSGTSPFAAGLFFGLKAAVLAILLQAVLRLSRRALTSDHLRAAAALAFLALFVFGLPFPLVVIGAGAAGWMLVRSGKLRALAEDAEEDGAEGGAPPVPARGRPLLILTVGCGLWIAPVLVLIPVFGADTTYTAVAFFFSKMAVITFGGAYAVLAYVAQAAVDTYGWLAPGEMMDGLALAETTPGPLILVLTFVGFLATFRDAAGAPPLVGGLIGAFLATWVTFVPCFLWILLGAPSVERLRRNTALSGALAVITAAVVGVIAHLALWFAMHVLFGRTWTFARGPISVDLPVVESFDPTAGALAALAAFLLMRTRSGLPGTLAVCAAAGLIAA
jgi:chromate transporter